MGAGDLLRNGDWLRLRRHIGGLDLGNQVFILRSVCTKISAEHRHLLRVVAVCVAFDGRIVFIDPCGFKGCGVGVADYLFEDHYALVLITAKFNERASALLEPDILVTRMRVSPGSTSTLRAS